MKEKQLQNIRSELSSGMDLAKCRKCGCMKESLEAMRQSLQLGQDHQFAVLVNEVEQWLNQMEPIRYACLGCEYCYPAVATNLLHQAEPEITPGSSLSCGFEVDEQTWPPVPGEYYAFCNGSACPVAVTTLGSVDLAEALASRRPTELCIVGKTETENIGIDKIITNTVTNPTIRFLVVAGNDPEGHRSGSTLLALMENGVDEQMRVIGSPGKRPVLRNVRREEIEAFRKQIHMVDMVGCEDSDEILKAVQRLPGEASLACSGQCNTTSVSFPPISTVPVIKAEPPSKLEMDRAGYFVILPEPAKGTIRVEHYAYDNRLQRVIEGKDARSIYWTLIKSGWLTQLSHAAYLGKELERAALSLKLGFKYVQDGA